MPLPEKHINGAVEIVRWTGAEGQAECGACHEAPPPAPHPEIDDCGLCHSPAYEDGQVNPDYHFDGQFQLIVYTAADDQPACGACHAVPPAAPHLQNDDCALCHPAAFDEDGNLDRAGTSTCSSTC